MNVLESRNLVNVTEEPEKNQKGMMKWIKEHKMQLILAGGSISSLIIVVLCLKNKKAIEKQCNLLKEQIKKGSLYSEKWFKTSSLEELKDARNTVQLDYRNPELDMDYRSKCKDLLDIFDKFIGKKEWAGKGYGYPAYTANGWHLFGDD